MAYGPRPEPVSLKHRKVSGLDCHMQVDLTGFRVKELSERRKLRGLRTRSGEAADRTTKS